MRNKIRFAENDFIYHGYINLTLSNCSQDSIDTLRNRALAQNYGMEHIKGKYQNDVKGEGVGFLSPL